jgi:hypothetical protein
MGEKMKCYLDSLDSFYSINHEKQASKNKPKDNNETIGKISLILIIAFVVYIIWTIIDAYVYAFPYLEYSGYTVDMNIRYPENWVYNEYGGGIFSNDDYSTVFVPSSEVSFLSNLTASFPDANIQIGKQRDLPYKNMPLDLYFDYEKKLKISQGYNITNTGKTNLSDGRPAYEIDAVNNDVQDKTIVVLMNKNPESYYFVYSAKPDKFNTYLSIAQQMFKTLSFK